MKNAKKSATIVALIIAVTVAFVLVSCSSTSHVIVGKTRPPILPGDVKVYMKPPARYEEVALLESSSKNSWSITDQGKTDKAIQRMKEEAAKLGANGVLLRGVSDRYAGDTSTGSAVGTSGSSGVGVGFSAPVYDKAASGVAIYVVQE